MDAQRVALLREVLAGTRWPSEARGFAGALRSRVVPQGGGLLLVGTRAYEPWHLAAHLVDEAAWSGRPELTPTLVRHRVPADAPAHLTVGLGRLAAAGRGETLLVVAPGPADQGLLERVHGARRAGATVFSLDGGDPEMHALAHEALTVAGAVPPPGEAEPEAARDPGRVPAPRATPEPDVDFDTVQHLVSAAAGEAELPAVRGRYRLRDRLALLADRLTAPPPARW
ncbi:hypothetical protein [Streptomyces tremellae]|uniref:Uncharacterized protein n=1 Tax=Streptomyces tremellae TaxID=1124239 RepID=A0ABP7FZW1_9ACTN